MFKHSFLLSIIFILAVMSIQAQGQQYTRLKGYYRIYQNTGSILNCSIDGVMEFYVPFSDIATEASEGRKGSSFIGRKFLGEHRRKAPEANGNDTFVHISLPNLERQTLPRNIDNEEYSAHNSGDVYRWADKCGKISKEKRKINGKIEVMTTLEMDELVGQPKHEMGMSQLRVYGIVARMIQYDESESYLSNNLLLVSQKYQTFFAHHHGEGDDERIGVWSELYVSDRMTTTKSELKRIKKKKNSVWTFSTPAVVPPLDKEVVET